MINFIDLGTMPYGECWELQKKLTTGHDKDIVLFVEHPPVYTLGKSGRVENLLVDEAFLTALGAEFYKIDRGGDITFHGPGQLVVYPILNLNRLGMGVREYVHTLEQVVIETVAEFGIAGERKADAPGIWVGSKKIAALGVRVSRGITMHGLALNVATDLRWFSHINPCGFSEDGGRGVTSMERETGGKVTMEEVKKILKNKIINHYAHREKMGGEAAGRSGGGGTFGHSTGHLARIG